MKKLVAISFFGCVLLGSLGFFSKGPQTVTVLANSRVTVTNEVTTNVFFLTSVAISFTNYQAVSGTVQVWKARSSVSNQLRQLAIQDVNSIFWTVEGAIPLAFKDTLTFVNGTTQTMYVTYDPEL